MSSLTATKSPGVAISRRSAKGFVSTLAASAETGQLKKWRRESASAVAALK
jgi:hypothetical protein